MEKDDISIDCYKITDDEMEEWLVTSIKVLAVLKEENQETYTKVYKDFIFDLQRLKDTERITDRNYEEIIESL